MKRFASILVVALTACLCLAFVPACSSEPSPSEVVKSALDAMKAQDTEALAKYYSGDMGSLEGSIDSLGQESGDMTEEQSSLMESFANKLYDFDYELGEETIDGDTATVAATLTTYDMGTAFGEAISDYFNTAFAMAFSGASQEDMENLLYDSLRGKIDALTEKTHTADIEFTLTKTDSGWMLDAFSDETADAFTGGMLSTATDMSNSLSGL